MRIALFSSTIVSMLLYVQSQCLKSHLPELHIRVVSPYNKNNQQETFYIVGFFPAMLKSKRYFNRSGFVWIEVAKFAFKQLIEMYHKLGLNINLELLIYDTCNQINIASTQMLDILLQGAIPSSQVPPNCCSTQNISNNIIGFIGPASSTTVDHMLKITSSDRYPLISYSATSVRFHNRLLYPTFLRTIPPDNFQARLILDVVLKYRWNYVSIVAQDNEYGRTGMNELHAVFGANQICTSIEYLFNSKDKDSLKSTIKQMHEDPFVNVIIVYASGLATREFLLAASKYKLYSKTFILLESANENPEFLTFDPNIVQGMLSVVHDSGVYQKFEEQFKTLTYKNNGTENQWLKRFFEFVNNNVTYNSRIDYSIEEYWEFLPMIKNGNVYNSVSAYAYAIKDFVVRNPYLCSLNVTTNCLRSIVRNRRNFFENYLQKTVFYDLYKAPTTFDEEGNMNHSQFFLSSPQFEKGVLKWKRVARWSKSFGVRVLANFLWVNNQTSRPESKCGNKCSPGTERRNNTKECCWTCIPCKGNTIKPDEGDGLCTECPFGTHRNKDHTKCLPLTTTFIRFDSTVGIIILALAFFNVFIVLVFTIIFIIFRKTPVVVSSQLAISLSQFLFLSLMSLTALTGLGEPDDMKCQVKGYFMPFVIVLTISPTILKTSRYLTVFKAKRILTHKSYFRTSGVFMLLVVIVVQGVLIFIANTFESYKTKSATVNIEKFELHVSCSYRMIVYLEAVYVLILLMICGISAFRARGLPHNYNEARLISYTMFLCCTILIFLLPLYESYHEGGTKNIIVSLGILLIALTILLVMYSQKVWIIIFCSNLNTIEHFTRSRMQKINKDISRHYTRNSPPNSHCLQLDATASYESSPVVFYKGRSVTILTDITDSTPQATPKL